jgi:tripartite-type tricarboxylate transporter receptor subunit TctC
MRRMTHWVVSLAISAVGLLAFSTEALLAQSWPQRTVRVILSFGTGVGPDFTARLFAERLAERWKQPVVVENRPGADGMIGVNAFVALRDDHSLLFSFAAPLSLFPMLHEKLAYDPARDLQPIASAADTFVSLTASASLKVGSLRELVTLARSQPGKLNYNASGGALPYLFAGFAKSASLDMVLVPYREFNLAYQDLAEGRLQVMLATMAGMLPHVHAGKVRILAVTNKGRAPIAPDVPTAVEAGYPALAFEGLIGFFGPRNMPAGRRDSIAADIRVVASEPSVADRLAAMGQIARGSTPPEFAAAIEEQRVKMAGIMKLTGAKPTQ